MDEQLLQDSEKENPDVSYLLSFHREVGIRRDVTGLEAVGRGQVRERSTVSEERILGESKLPVGSRNGAEGESYGQREGPRSNEEARSSVVFLRL